MVQDREMEMVGREKRRKTRGERRRMGNFWKKQRFSGFFVIVFVVCPSIVFSDVRKRVYMEEDKMYM